MDLKAVSIFITASANFVLGTYVFLKNPRKIINISFSLFVFSVVLWSLAIFVIGASDDYQVIKFAGHLTFFGGALMACNFLMFSHVFPDVTHGPVSEKLLVRIYLPGILAAIAAFSPYVLENIMYIGDRVRPVYGKGILIYTLYCVWFTGYGLFLLGRKYLSEARRYERVQLKYTLWGLLVPVSGVVLITLVLPQLGISRFSDMTPLLTVLIVSFISYAIVRHRLMDLGVVFRNVLIYVSTGIAITIILVALLFVLVPVLKLAPGGMAFLSAACAAVLVLPLRHYTQILVDTYYFRGRYDYRAALAEFSSSMTRILNITDLQNRIVGEVASILNVKSTALLLPDENESEYSIKCSIPSELGDSAGAFGTDNIIVERINRDRTLLVKDEMRRMLPRSEYERFEREFERIDAEVLIPLFYRGELSGMLALGEKESADIYSGEDLSLLTTLGNQAAVAVENALLHHKVTMLMHHNESILKHMNSGVIATDREQVLSTCNDKAREVLRLPHHGVLGKKVDILPAVLQEMLAATLEGKATYTNHEVEILSEHNTLAYLSAGTSQLKDEDDGVTGALLVFNDLTEIKLLESEMWRADKLASLGTLAAGMAHEIKNPLVSIKTFAQLLPTRYEDKDFRDTFSNITVDEVERINSIVEKLLEFARPSMPMFESVDVIEIIEEVLMLLTPEFTKHDVTVARSFENASAPIVGDKGQLKQALLNLCLNGMQAMQDIDKIARKELSITVGFRKRRHHQAEGEPVDEIAQMFYGTEVPATAEDAETLVVKVRDAGRGIGRKELARIFDPFFTTREKGLGLGLAVVHGIVKEHGGNISVDSKENSSTEFTISLPTRQMFAREKV